MKVALLIGAQDYGKRSGIQPLQFAHNDALMLADALRQRCGFTRTTALAGRRRAAGSTGPATRAAIRDALDRLAHVPETIDLLFVGVSAHGLTTTVDRTMRDYILPEDAHSTDNGSFLERATLIEWINRVPTKQRVVFFDACRNDPLTGRRAISNSMSRDLAIEAVEQTSFAHPDDTICVVESCSQGQTAQEWPEQRHGVFTYFLLEGIRKGATHPDGPWRDGGLRVSDLFDYAYRAIMRRPVFLQRPRYEQRGSKVLFLAQMPLGPDSTSPRWASLDGKPISIASESAGQIAQPRTPVAPSVRPPTRAEIVVKQQVIPEKSEVQLTHAREERERQALMRRTAAEAAVRQVEEDVRRAKEKENARHGGAAERPPATFDPNTEGALSGDADNKGRLSLRPGGRLDLGKAVNAGSVRQSFSRGRLSLRPGGRLDLGKAVNAGSVRQSFSVGRSKVVQVEVLKKRPTPGAPPAKPGVSGPAAKPGGPGAKQAGGAPAPQAKRATAQRPLTQAEIAMRQRVLDKQRKAEAQREREERERQALMVRSAAEEAARRAEEEDRRRAEEAEDAARAAAEARCWIAEASQTPEPSAPAAKACVPASTSNFGLMSSATAEAASATDSGIQETGEGPRVQALGPAPHSESTAGEDGKPCRPAPLHSVEWLFIEAMDLVYCGHGRNRGMIAEAVRLLNSASEEGYAPAQYILASLYRTGRSGLARDEAEAVRLYRLAALQGLASAQYELASLYENGSCGLACDEAKAASLYRLTADQGVPEAQYALGEMYEDGRGGLAFNQAEAVRLYRLAADQGVWCAEERLCELGLAP